jgi:hypothetical protein
MANQLSVQVVPRHAGWLLAGPETATSLAPQQDLTVTFPDSTSVTVPALVNAVLPGGGVSWDRTQAVVVGYVVLGDGTLRACYESQLAGLATDYAPLVRVLHDAVQVYRPQQPSGVGAAAGAWSGGAILSSARSGSGGARLDPLAGQSGSGGAQT